MSSTVPSPFLTATDHTPSSEISMAFGAIQYEIEILIEIW